MLDCSNIIALLGRPIEVLEAERLLRLLYQTGKCGGSRRHCKVNDLLAQR